MNPGFAETHDYISKLYGLLEDPDAAVIANSVMVLNELLLEKGGIEITQTTLIHLLNRIGEFSEWGLNAVLDLVSRYRPTSEEEMYAIMNLLDPVLRTANSGAVLATFKCFLCLSAHLPDMHPQILARAKPPLLTLIAGSNPETQFAVLKHMEVLLPREFAKGVFDDEFRQFFVRYSEPSYVKYLKTGLLPWIANEANAKDIVSELVEYVTDVDSELAKKSIIAMGEIAIRVNTYTQDIVQNLLDLVDLDTPYVRAQAVKTTAKVVRTYPYVRHQLLPVLAKCLRRVEDADAKAVLLWTLGEYGEELVEAPYLLESVVNNYADESSTIIKLSLLSASMKLFFKRAPEMQPVLGKLLARAVEDSTNQDIHDKGLLYYRLLAHSVDSAAAVFRSHFQEHSDRVVLAYAEERDTVKKEKIWKEFNSLSIVYAQPSTQFIKSEYQFVSAFSTSCNIPVNNFICSFFIYLYVEI